MKIKPRVRRTDQYRQIHARILKEVLKGGTHMTVTKMLLDEKIFKTQKTATLHYYKAVKSLMIESKEEFELAKSKYLETYHELYRETIAAKDFRTANSILDSIVKLLGLYVNKIEAKIDGDIQIKFDE